MKHFVWFWKGTIFWLCILNAVIDGHHNDTCLSSDGRPAICVANRYCRERFKSHLLPCADSKICCPIPIPSSPSSVTSVEEPARRPSNSGRPQSYPQDDAYSPKTEDGPLRKPVTSYDQPVKELPSTRPGEDERPRYSPEIYEDSRSPPRGADERDRPKAYGDDLPPSRPEDGRSRKPIRDYDKPVEDPPPRRPLESGRPRYDAEDLPSVTRDGDSRRPINTQRKPSKEAPRRPVSNERPRQNKPTYDDDKEYARKPIDVYDEPVDRTPTRTRDEPARPIGRPRYDDDLERPKKPGKVIFEEDSFRDRPSGAKPIDFDDASRSEYYPMPRRESSNKRGQDSVLVDERPRPDDYEKRRQHGDVPRYYPPEDDVEVLRDPPRRVSEPTRVVSRNRSIDGSKSTDRFPELHGVPVSQPKVPECGVKPYELFIAGGDATEPHEWPWMTAIFRRHQNSRPKTFICGGALINTKYVLTAAHCFVHNYVILPASTFVVRVGSHQLSSGEEYTVSDLVIHHNHSGSDFFNDIALLRLAGDVYVTDKVAPICLPFPGMRGETFVGRSATVAGWGDTAFRTGGSRSLQHVTIPIVSSDECYAAYSRVRGAAFLARGSDHVICAGLREGGKDACLGDSGGPLMLKATEDQWIVVGIVSLGYKCAEPGYPGVYTRVTHYMSWIQNNMKQH